MAQVPSKTPYGLLFLLVAASIVLGLASGLKTQIDNCFNGSQTNSSSNNNTPTQNNNSLTAVQIMFAMISIVIIPVLMIMSAWEIGTDFTGRIKAIILLSFPVVASLMAGAGWGYAGYFQGNTVQGAAVSSKDKSIFGGAAGCMLVVVLVFFFIVHHQINNPGAGLDDVTLGWLIVAGIAFAIAGGLLYNVQGDATDPKTGKTDTGYVTLYSFCMGIGIGLVVLLLIYKGYEAYKKHSAEKAAAQALS